MNTKLILSVLALTLTGCSSTGRKNAEQVKRFNEIAGFYKPHLLFQKAPLTQLYVEVDAMETAVPSQESLDVLKRFLEQVVEQPVTIERSDVITTEYARDRSSTALALEHMNGPPDASSAYMYIHFYDSKLLQDEETEPQAMIVPHPATIGIDRQYGPPSLGKLKQLDGLFLIHECSHLLGLTRNTEHGDGLHCTNENCLMRHTIKMNRWFFIYGQEPYTQTECCSDCLADLKAYREEPAPDNVRFQGPYCVRAEAEYYVFTLPGLVYIHVGQLEDLDQKNLDAHREKTIRILNDDPHGLRLKTSPLDLDVAERMIPLLRKDPYKPIQILADDLEKKLDAKRTERAE